MKPGRPLTLAARLLLLLLAALPTRPVPAQTPAGAPLPTAAILQPEQQGAQLAARLREAAPVAADEFQGSLEIIARDDSITTLPIVSRITPGTNHWSVSYLARDPAGRPLEELTILHAPGRPNAYRLAAGPASNTVPAPPLSRPFAGSDFWLGDLGLEFLHWPGQRVVTNEMRHSRSCWVLESTTPKPEPGGYARVLSWIDVEHDGILRADAHGPDGRLLKEFRLGPMRKIDGRWQLESMKMRTRATDSETELRFNLARPGR
ncbi:MAG: hypothetical protein RJA22_1978 [Verrucomicrobiota bacterium]